MGNKKVVGYISSLMLGKQSNGQKSTTQLLGTTCSSFDHRSTFDQLILIRTKSIFIGKTCLIIFSFLHAFPVVFILFPITISIRFTIMRKDNKLYEQN